MKILHTADWHLGKRLEHISRLDEQRQVLNEICDITEREAVDVVLIAGDLFDHANPSIEAIELLYETLKRLANNGKRAVIGIAGNHDSPDRIEAPDPLARACGILLAGYPDSHIRKIHLESGLAIAHSEPGFIELTLPSQEAPLRLLLTPYANAIRLQKYLGHEQSEENLRSILQAHWQQLADRYCDDQGVNILMAHLFVMEQDGTPPEESEDERTVLTVGGAGQIFTRNFPSNLQYVALGHLHRKQQISPNPCPILYSGSPLAYSMSEAGQQKQVILVEAEPGQAVQIKPIPLQQGKSLFRKTFDEVSEAVTWLQAHPDSLVELTLKTDHFLSATDRKLLYDAHPGIVNLIPQLTNPELIQSTTSKIDLSKDMEGLFADYFEHKHGQAPNEALMAVFREMLGEE